MQDQPIPRGYCQCGCGQKTPLYTQTKRAKGYVAGQPARYVKGHNGRRPLAERFWEKVDKDGPGGCWLWTGALQPAGYGLIGTGTGPGQHALAHRVAYEMTIGPIPLGMDLDHVRARGCRHRSCVNPRHLEPVTRATNVQRGGLAKLTPQQVRDVRSAAASGETRASIARRYGIGWTTVDHVVAGRTWRE